MLLTLEEESVPQCTLYRRNNLFPSFSLARAVCILTSNTPPDHSRCP